APRVREGGIILANNSLFKPEKPEGRELYQLPANNLAEETGSVLASNMILLGAFASLKRF
ncbi:MAG TPA: 2-oxoacid:acceptor oxidoreductase family protein, partial [bacterium]|nr:2-oxoacid:acceptor oxidoreductase family protein [bacterium]